MPPVSPTRILVVTRLDVEGAGATWVPVIEAMERGGAAPLALVPHAASAAPAELRERISMVPWDRSTTAAFVRRLVRERR